MGNSCFKINIFKFQKFSYYSFLLFQNCNPFFCKNTLFFIFPTHPFYFLLSNFSFMHRILKNGVFEKLQKKAGFSLKKTFCFKKSNNIGLIFEQNPMHISNVKCIEKLKAKKWKFLEKIVLKKKSSLFLKFLKNPIFKNPMHKIDF